MRVLFAMLILQRKQRMDRNVPGQLHQAVHLHGILPLDALTECDKRLAWTSAYLVCFAGEDNGRTLAWLATRLALGQHPADKGVHATG